MIFTTQIGIGIVPSPPSSPLSISTQLVESRVTSGRASSVRNDALRKAVQVLQVFALLALGQTHHPGEIFGFLERELQHAQRQLSSRGFHQPFDMRDELVCDA